MEDDFIEEDNGVSGYADHGMDDWDRSGSEKDEDEDLNEAEASECRWSRVRSSLPLTLLPTDRTPTRGEEGR